MVFLTIRLAPILIFSKSGMLYGVLNPAINGLSLSISVVFLSLHLAASISNAHPAISVIFLIINVLCIYKSVSLIFRIIINLFFFIFFPILFGCTFQQVLTHFFFRRQLQTIFAHKQVLREAFGGVLHSGLAIISAE